MKRIIIICEGQTEKEFCIKILAPYFLNLGMILQTPLIKKSMGGIVKWEELQKQINMHLASDKTAFVTTFIDYYGLYSNHNFPNWNQSLLIADKNARMDYLEQSMLESITDSMRNRYLPYIQLHEFEGLLFNDIRFFQQQIPAKELVGIIELQNTFAQYSNPEMINDNRETSPSHRLVRIVSGYNKIVYGTYLAEAIGLQNIRAKCPRFNQWVANIQKL